MAKYPKNVYKSGIILHKVTINKSTNKQIHAKITQN
jgi:hypothetical protein